MEDRAEKEKKTVRLYAAARACRWATVVLIPDPALRLLVTMSSLGQESRPGCGRELSHQT